MDIRDAIGVSFSWSQFVKEMEKRGYTWKLNRKYPALKTPDMERYVRLRSLGKGYGEAEIREKILRPKIQQVYGKTQVQFPKRKLTGLQKLYFSYLPRIGCVFCLCACPDLLSQFGKWYASGYITGFVHGVSVFRLQSDFSIDALFVPVLYRRFSYRHIQYHTF